MNNFFIINELDIKLSVITHKLDNPDAILIHLHGLHGHFQYIYNCIDDFNERIEYFKKANILSYALEFRGHGKSSGKKGVINNIDNFVESFNNIYHVRQSKDYNMIICFYDSLYNCLFNMFNDEIYCKYHAKKILNEIDRTLDVLYYTHAFNIYKKHRYEAIVIIYQLIESYLTYYNYDKMGIFDTENICYLNCDICNKKTCWDNINLNEKLFNDKNICEKCISYTNTNTNTNANANSNTNYFK